MITKKKLAFVVFIATCLSAFLFTAAPLDALSGKSVKIAVYGPYTGLATQYGLSTRIALEIAYDDIKGKIGGVPVELLFFDTGSKADQAVSIMKKLTSMNDLLMVIGPALSSEAEASFPVANKAGLPTLSPNAAVDGLTARNRPWTFRLREGTDDEARDGVRQLRENFPNFKTCATISDVKDRYNKTNGVVLSPKLLTEAGVKVLKETAFQSGDIDYSAQVTQIKVLKPDFVLVSAFAQDASNIAKELRKQGVTQHIYGVSAGILEPTYLQLGGEAANYTFYLSNWAIGRQERPQTQRLIKEWIKRFPAKDVKPASWHFWWYDALMIAKKVIEEQGVTNLPGEIEKDRLKIRKGLEALKDYTGTTYNITMTKDGEIMVPKDRRMVMIKDGKYNWIMGPNNYVPMK
jgi:branched-chain amino acid transport system substrate-binding protein